MTTIATVAAALWLGILTSISPCPLATNVAAVSFVSKGVGRSTLVILTGLLYGLGRALAYTGLVLLIAGSLISTPHLSNALQYWLNLVLGPLMLIVAMLLLEVIRLPVFFSTSVRVPNWLGRLNENRHYIGTLMLGILFAPALCPISAAIFFGALVPIAIQPGALVIAPLAYGFGTALPVFFFAFVIALSANRLSEAFRFTEKLEVWARTATGVVFALVGIYFCLTFNLRLI